MSLLTKSLPVVAQLLLVLCFMVSTGEAANKTLRDTAINIDTYAKVDDVTSAFTGLNSFMVDNVERGFQQWFWYRVGPSGAEMSLDKLPKKAATTQPTTSSLLSSYTLAGQFDISVLYELTPYPSGAGKASLKKTITITNISAADLNYHLFEYSDYDLSEIGTLVGDSDNIEVVNNKVYQNGPQSTGGVTYTQESSLPPTKFDLDNGSGFIKDNLNDTGPSDFYIPETPYGYGDDRQFVKQWDIAIPAGQSVSFTITDNFYPTLPVTASAVKSGTCVTYGGQADYTINFDNLANPATSTEDITNLKIIDTLPKNTTPTTNPPTDGSVYDSTANTVTWNLPTLAAGAANQSKQLTITVNSPYDITNNVLLVSDQAFPTRLPDPALDPVPTDSLCNHPPGINPISNGSISEGSSFSTQVLAGDSDNNALAYSLSGAPVGMTISSSGLINYPVAVAGTYTITVTVTDNGVGALTGSKTFTLTVTKVNHPPIITSVPVITASIGVPYKYTVTATDQDNDPLTYILFTVPGGSNMLISAAGEITWTPVIADAKSPQPIKVGVYDGSTYTYQDFTITVGSALKQNPVITWAAPAAISYDTALSASQLNATIDGGVPGSFSYSPASGAVLNVGSQTLTTTFTPSDTTTYNVVSKTVTLIVNQATASLTLGNLSFTYDGSAKATTATTTPADKSVAITYAGSSTAPTAAGTYAIVATVTDANYTGSADGSLVIAKATPTVSWAAPSAIHIGTTLSAAQLNATANVAGAFVYTPASGTVMNTTGANSLSADFTPADTANYNNASATVSITVNNKQNPGITWTTPAAITYGSALSATQLNATIDGGVPGNFSYSPASGVVLNAGSQTLTATFTPSDTTTYNVVSKSVTLTVNQAAASVALGNLSFTYDGSAKATTATTTPADKSVAITYAGSSTAPTAAGTYAVVATITDPNYTGSANGSLVIAKATPVISWTAPAAIYIGTTLSATQLNATANVAGAFVYTPASGTVMNTTGANSLSADFTPADTANYNTASTTVSITINNKQNPVISWTTPATITYGTALSASQLNATIDGGIPGSFSYSPASGALLNAGSQTLTATFTPSDISTYNVVSKTVTLTVNQAAASVTLGNLSFTYDGSAKAATATTTPADKSVAITYAGSSTAPTAAGTYAVVATVTDANYTGSANGSLVIAKATPVISWTAPAAVILGSALTSTQLNASTTVAGSFVYTPASGTVMNTAGANSLSAAFTPADTANYNNASATVSITVNNKLNPVITWAAPSAITYGTALSASQLNATIAGGVPGSFSYSPASGAILNAGSQTMTATFTPSDTTAYNVVSKTVILTVNQAAASVALGNLSFTYDGSAKAATATTTPADKSVAITYAGSSSAPTAAGTYAVVATITDPNYTGSANGSLAIAKATPTVSWAAPSAISIGTTLSATQLNATTNVAGAFVYTPASGTVMNTTGANSLSAAFTPNDTANYNTASTTVSITINNKQNPVITWAAPSTITYGTALSASQLNATIDGGVPGSFSYSPASGAVLNAGSQTLTATFTPSDTTTYNVVSKTVTLTVNQAAASVALGNLNFTYDGSAKATTATTTPADKSVAITYAGSSTAPTVAGTYAVVATVTDANYTGSANGSLVIAKATPVISWTAPAAVIIGSALASTQLNATASAPGSFVYTPASGTIMNSAGNQTVTTVFTPTDTTNFSNATATVSITVNNKQNPTVSWTTPAAISYGTALSVSQLNATSNVPGSFVYTPAFGALLNIGPQTLSVIFTPNDTVTYNSASASVSLTVTPASTAKYPDGDVNGDGKVDISDALAALMMSVGLTPPTADKISHADVGPMKNYKPTPDGKIDIDDVVVLLLRAVGTIPAW